LRSFRSYLRFVSLLTAAAVALVGIGLFVAPRFGGSETVTAMLWGCGLSWIASLVGGLPQLFSEKSDAAPGVLVLGSTAIRMGVTLGGVLIVALGTEISKPSFLLWVALSYIVFLIVDVAFVLTQKSVG
jgi:hypothetical protein